MERNRCAPAVSPTSLAAVSAPQPGMVEQGRGELADEWCDFALEFVDAAVELADTVELLAADRGDQPVQVGEPRGDALDDVLELETASGDVKVGRDLVQMPADPALQAGSLGDQVVAMVDQQPHLARRAVELGDRQVRLAPCCAGDRERIDRVGLAALLERCAGRRPSSASAP